ncbi:hypothetical protein WBG78_20295 [Chryseolinea sp. T2]|uniref:hypothetical protein n=1 Tax=Chryseolinea sp. T2 TaxID=3129255 RepID=UPI0030768D21
MRIEKSLSWLFALILLIAFGCTDDKDLDFTTYEGNAKLKRSSMYSSVNDAEPIAIVDEYEYDSQGRISKVSSPLYNNGQVVGTVKYDLYEYNSHGQLTTVSNFNANSGSPTGYINLTNYSYTYSTNGLKEKQLIEYPQINSFEYITYFYKDDKLTKSEKYNSKDELQDYTVYEYNGDRLVKETWYSSKNEVNRITNHIFTNGLNTETMIYGGSNNEKIREIRKTYDANYNLIMIESTELATWSSATSYVMRYEYF